jgi:DNA invertase Pin-like site-specific DNA recombinase
MTNVGLARVSTLDQDPGLQLDALARAGCDRIFEERVSGVSAKRPIRDQVLAQLRRGDTLTCWRLDRLGRSMIEVVGIIQDLAARRVKFRSLSDNLSIDPDNANPMTTMQLQMLAMFSEYERSVIKERILAGKARMMAEGRHPGGRALFGFEADHVTVNEEQAELLREAVDLVLNKGRTLSHVVDTWNAQGLRPGDASHWRVTHLRRILLNERVVPIIGQENYDKLVRLFTDQERRKGGRPAIYLLSGVLTCSRCDRPLYGARIRRKGGVQELNYRCEAGKGSGGRHTGCGRTSVAMGRTDDHVREIFILSVVGEPFREALNQWQAELLATDVTAQDLDDWRAEIADLDQVQGTRFYNDAMRRRHDELRRMVEQATAQLMAAPDLQAMIDLPRSEEQLRARWSSWTIPQRRAWLKRLVERIEVKPATAGISLEERLVPIFKM